MRLLGVDAATFPELFTASRDAMKSAYPDVENEYARISQIAYGEEETFLKTLASGTTILDTAVTETKKSGSQALAGDTAFLLHDTFGFPIDLTLEMAEEAGLSVDRAAFDALMLTSALAQRLMPRQRSRFLLIFDLHRSAQRVKLSLPVTPT
jgi:alanyl-tRNA synthetase